jgi:hypothetical protein
MHSAAACGSALLTYMATAHSVDVLIIGELPFPVICLALMILEQVADRQA